MRSVVKVMSGVLLKEIRGESNVWSVTQRDPC